MHTLEQTIMTLGWTGLICLGMICSGFITVSLIWIRYNIIQRAIEILKYGEILDL